MANILIIDDDVAVRDYLSTLVSRLQHQPLVAATCAQGLAQLANPAVNVVIADIYLPDSPPLKQWIKQLRDAAALAQRGEVLAFLTKPFELAFIKSLLSRALANPPSA